MNRKLIMYIAGGLLVLAVTAGVVMTGTGRRNPVRMKTDAETEKTAETPWNGDESEERCSEAENPGEARAKNVKNKDKDMTSSGNEREMKEYQNATPPEADTEAGVLETQIESGETGEAKVRNRKKRQEKNGQETEFNIETEPVQEQEAAEENRKNATEGDIFQDDTLIELPLIPAG